MSSLRHRLPPLTYEPRHGRWLSRDPMPRTKTDLPHLYRYVENRPITAIDGLGLAIAELSFAEESPHGSIERYRPSSWPWAEPYESLSASKGSPASKSWGSVGFDFTTDNSTFLASVSAMTDVSKAPSDTTYLQASADVHGKIKVKACCGSKKIDIAWSAEATQDRGNNAEVTIDSFHFVVTESGKSFTHADTFTLQAPSANGEVSFYVLVATYWQDVPPSAGRQSGAATLSVNATCHCD